MCPRALRRLLVPSAILIAGVGGITASASAAPVGTLDVDCPGGSNAGFVIFNGGGGWAQTFTAGSDGKLLFAEIRGISRAAGSTGADVNVDVRPTAGGVPTGPVLATGSIAGAGIPADSVARNYEVTFPAAGAAFLEGGTTYALGLRTTDTAQNAWTVHTDTCAGTVYVSTGADTFGLFGFVSGEDAGHSTYLGPENDDYSRALTLTGTADSHDGTTAGATREPDEPDHYVTNPPDSDLWIGDHSVWYRWVAANPSMATLDVCTAAIDSILAVYEGDASTPLAGLTRVADNNNDASCPPGTFGSYLTFAADAGTEYRIAIGDAGGARESTFTLDLAADEAPEITPLKPAPGARISNRRPRIKATVIDAVTDLAADDIDFYVDGTPRGNFTYDQATDMLKFRKRLARGRHTVQIDATDEPGTVGTGAWKFRIRR